MKRKRRNGEGTYYFDERRGRWVGQLSIRDASGRNVRKKVYGRTERAAEKAGRDLLARYAAGARALDRSMTLEAFVPRWIEDGIPMLGIKESTKTQYLYNWEHYVRPIWGRRKLCDIRIMDVERGLNVLVGKGFHAGTIKNARAVLSSILNEAVRHELIEANPVRGARTPQVSVKRQRGAMNHEQVAQLFSATRGQRIHGPVVLGILTGLRPGEVLSLRWEHLDITSESPTLRVVESKTTAGRRTVVLPSYVVEVLRGQRKQNILMAKRTNGMWSDDGFVFPSNVGSKWDYANFLKTFTTACRDAGIGHWTPHEMRHTAASLLLSAGVSVHEVAETLGHRDINTTFRVYGHQIKQSDNVRAAMEDVVPESVWRSA